MSRQDYEPTKEEFIRLGEMAGFEVTVDEPVTEYLAGLRDEARDAAEASAATAAAAAAAADGAISADAADIVEPGLAAQQAESKLLIEEMTRTIIAEGCDDFIDFVSENMWEISEAARRDQDVADALVMCYKLGVAHENGPCANNLGALYYAGDIVEQDYAKAAELYDMAMNWGCFQSIINLGYIYEYGRIGQPDHQKAFTYYALAAALDPHYEALYKLGDMFSRGRAVPRDIKKAYLLWQKSFYVAQDIEEQAQAAIRIAPLLLDRANSEYGIPYNPLSALQHYHTAEIGLRISIGKGMTYYSKRLREALDGQDKARLALLKAHEASLA